MQKVAWSGTIAAVQPRIRLIRCDDERQHSYHGYVLRIEGTCGGESGEVMVAVGRAAHEKHRFRVGMEVSGLAVPVADPEPRRRGGTSRAASRSSETWRRNRRAARRSMACRRIWIRTARADIAGWTPGPTIPGAPPALGVVACRWYWCWIAGTRPRNVIGSRPFAMVPRVVASTGPGGSARCRAKRGRPTLKETGSTSRPRRTAGPMSEERKALPVGRISRRRNPTWCGALPVGLRLRLIRPTRRRAGANCRALWQAFGSSWSEAP